MKMNKSGKKRPKKFIFILFFIVGFLITSYPFVSQLYYNYTSTQVNQDFDAAIAKIESADLENRFRLAQAFNATLKPAELSDPFTASEKKEGVAEYANMLKINEQIGYVEIPKIGQEIPMYVGTSESVLQKGAGLLEGTSLPVGGENTHTVITAHRGLPTAQLFTQLDKLKEGDIFYLHVLDKVLAYEVDQILVVEPDDFTPVLIQEKQDYATLLTCTPYMVNTHRLLVRGKRIDYTAPVKERDLQTRRITQRWFILLLLAVGIILLLLYRIYRNRKVVQKQLEELARYKNET